MSGIQTHATGNIATDIGLRHSDEGTPVASFRVACSERRYDATNGRWTDGPTTYISCVAFRGLADNIAESLAKGDRVVFTGVLTQRDYTDPETDEARTRYEIRLDSIGPELQFSSARPRKAERAQS